MIRVVVVPPVVVLAVIFMITIVRIMRMQMKTIVTHAEIFLTQLKQNIHDCLVIKID